jgi:hypothetical protein
MMRRHEEHTHCSDGGRDTHTTRQKAKNIKTYNSGYSLVVTHLTTNPPVRCLSKAERTGSPVFNVLWSYVLNFDLQKRI